MAKHYVFDVDGTLTPSRQKMDEEFFAWFDDFCSDNSVHFVTGSDYSKTVEQLSEYLCEKVETVYNCSGNDVWSKGKNIRTSDWKLDSFTREWLDKKLAESKFSLRTGNHIEERPGSVNFSIVGRNATLSERKLYVDFDTQTNERKNLTAEFNYIFGEESKGLTAQVGGDTGLDIYPIGNDKSQILSDFRDKDEIIFFGDKMDIGGNDYPLAAEIYNQARGGSHHVSGWQETWELLKSI